MWKRGTALLTALLMLFSCALAEDVYLDEPTPGAAEETADDTLTARDDLINRIIALGQELYIKANGKSQRAHYKRDIYVCKNFTTYLFRQNRDDFCMAEYPDVQLLVPNNLSAAKSKPYSYGIEWEDISPEKGNPFYIAAQFKYDKNLSAEENMALACDFMRQAQRGDYFQMSAKYEYGTGAHSAIMLGYDPETDEIHWMDSNMRGGKKKGIRYGLVQFDEVKSVEWWASTFCKKKVTNTIHTPGAFVFVVATFNILGYCTLRISSWMNRLYSNNLRWKWKFIAVYIGVMLLFLLLNYGLLVAAKLMGRAENPFTFQIGGIRILLVVWLVELVILGLLLANRSIKNALRLQQKAAQLQKENNAARYTALQNQLNPHFLFNSLNTLIAEIEYNPSNAVRFTRNLSDVYRYVLQSQDKTLITLGEELEFIQSYLFLHEVRLGNCIACNITIPTEAMEYQLPPLTLQLLVENVIKHNSINSNKPMDITIQIVDHFLVVSNPIHAKKSDTTSGVGLQNLSNRCKLMIGTDIIINNENHIFTVKVPLIYE